MTPTIVEDFLKICLKKILVNNDSPNFTPQQLNDCLYTCNEIIDSWNADGKMIYAQSFNTFPLTGGQQIYTIGPGADFNVPTRPTYLEYAAYQQTNIFPVVDIPLRILSEDEWMSIRTKNIASTISNYIYMDAQYPVANIYLWTIPSISSNLVLTYWNFLNSNLTLQTVLSFPPGYQRAIGLDVAVNIAPFFGKAAGPEVQQMSATLAVLKKQLGFTNLRGSRMQYSADAQGTRSDGGAYNIYNDQVY